MGERWSMVVDEWAVVVDGGGRWTGKCFLTFIMKKELAPFADEFLAGWWMRTGGWVVDNWAVVDGLAVVDGRAVVDGGG